MVPRQPAERIPELLAACDAAFISFMDDPLFEKTIPAKLQSYLACGMPVVAAAKGETERIILEAECGTCCPNGDAEGLAENIRKMMTDPSLPEMRQRAKAYFDEHFEKSRRMDDFEEILRQLMQ